MDHTPWDLCLKKVMKINILCKKKTHEPQKIGNSHFISNFSVQLKLMVKLISRL